LTDTLFRKEIIEKQARRLDILRKPQTPRIKKSRGL